MEEEGKTDLTPIYHCANRALHVFKVAQQEPLGRAAHFALSLHMFVSQLEARPLEEHAFRYIMRHYDGLVNLILSKYGR